MLFVLEQHEEVAESLVLMEDLPENFLSPSFFFLLLLLL